jgi:hypothetical protein
MQPGFRGPAVSGAMVAGAVALAYGVRARPAIRHLMQGRMDYVRVR